MYSRQPDVHNVHIDVKSVVAVAMLLEVKLFACEVHSRLGTSSAPTCCLWLRVCAFLVSSNCLLSLLEHSWIVPWHHVLRNHVRRQKQVLHR
jgi:hypothetical protein